MKYTDNCYAIKNTTKKKTKTQKTHTQETQKKEQSRPKPEQNTV